jgi:hypothetical protein
MEKKTVMRTYRRTSWWRLLSLTVISAGSTLPAHAQDDALDLAKKLANPIASLISVPLQYNYDEFGGANDGGEISRLNIQPVIPFSIGDDWNLITRTIVPLIDQSGFPLDAINESGLGDIVASQFFSPKAPTASGWVSGAGPVLLLPTASDDALGSKKWGIGPTAVALKQTGPWTVGFLGNHVWSVAGDDDRADISATFLQPFASYVTKTQTTISLATESTYDWEAKQWSVPVVLQVAQLFKIGPQILQFTVGAKYWAEAPDDGPDGWGLRAQLTFLFPR